MSEFEEEIPVKGVIALRFEYTIKLGPNIYYPKWNYWGWG